MKKSQIVGFILTLLFGPLGLFYSSVPAALGFLVAAIVFGLFTGGVGAVLIWPVSIIVGVFTVRRHNDQVALEETRHQELLEATKTGRHVE